MRREKLLEALKKLKDSVAQSDGDGDFISEISSVNMALAGSADSESACTLAIKLVERLAGDLENLFQSREFFDSDTSDLDFGDSEDCIPLCPVWLALLDLLEELDISFPDNPAISSAVKSCRNIFESRAKDEYRQFAGFVFSNDVRQSLFVSRMWAKMNALAKRCQALGGLSQLDRMSMMLVDNEYNNREIRRADKILSDIAELGTDYFNEHKDPRFILNSDKQAHFYVINRIQQIRDEALVTLLIGERANSEYKKIKAGVKSVRDILLNCPSSILMSAYEFPDDLKKREKLHTYVTRFIKATESLPDSRPDVFTVLTSEEHLGHSIKEFKNLTDEEYDSLAYSSSDIDEKLSAALREGTAGILKTYGMDSGYDGSKLNSFESAFIYAEDEYFLPLWEIKSHEADALKDEILRMQKNFANMRPVNYEEYLPVHDAAMDYLNFHAADPKTPDEQKIHDVISIILRVVSTQIAAAVGGETAVRIVNDIKSYMLRNKAFRDQMVEVSETFIQYSYEDYSLLFRKDHDTHITNAVIYLAFAKLCDKGLGYKGLNMIPDTREAEDKLNFMISEVDKRLIKSYGDLKVQAQILPEDEIESVLRYVETAEGTATVAYMKRACSNSFMFAKYVNTDGAFKLPVGSRLGLDAAWKDCSSLSALAAIDMMKSGYKLSEIYDEYINDSARSEAGSNIIVKYNSLENDELGAFVADYLLWGLENIMPEMDGYLRGLPQVSGKAIEEFENRYLVPSIALLSIIINDIDKPEIRPLVNEAHGAAYVDNLLQKARGGIGVLKTMADGYAERINSLCAANAEKYQLSEDGERSGIDEYVSGSFAKVIAGVLTREKVKEEYHQDCDFFEFYRNTRSQYKSIEGLEKAFLANEQLMDAISVALIGDAPKNASELVRGIASGSIFSPELISVDENGLMQIDNLESELLKIKSQ